MSIERNLETELTNIYDTQVFKSLCEIPDIKFVVFPQSDTHEIPEYMKYSGKDTSIFTEKIDCQIVCYYKGIIMIAVLGPDSMWATYLQSHFDGKLLQQKFYDDISDPNNCVPGGDFDPSMCVSDEIFNLPENKIKLVEILNRGTTNYCY